MGKEFVDSLNGFTCTLIGIGIFMDTKSSKSNITRIIFQWYGLSLIDPNINGLIFFSQLFKS